MLSGPELKEKYPIMNSEGVLGGVYSPYDGSLDPAGWCEALVRAAKSNGAQVNFVIDIHTKLLLCSKSRPYVMVEQVS